MSAIKPPAIFLMGATATGKTAAAIEILKHYPCEIISVDSALIYKDLNIGTAKPSQKELQTAPHFLVNIIDPEQSYSAWEFRRDALQKMQEITDRGNIPLLVGGTMLYFNALEFGLDELPKTDEKIRQSLTKRLNEEGIEMLYKELQTEDLVSAEKIKPSDSQRIIRALEVKLSSGKRLSDLQTHQTEPNINYNLLKIIFSPEDRTLLHQRIEQRFTCMLDSGFVEEVTALRLRGTLSLNHPSMRCVGYRQVWNYLENMDDFQTMQEKACAATRQLAKRQITWLRKQKNARWFDSETLNTVEVLTYIKEFLASALKK